MARLVRLPSFPLRASLVVLALVLSSTISSGRLSQSPGTGAFAAVGAQPTRGYFPASPWSQVDMVNGNLTMSFTDLVLPGNAGMDLRITRTYNHQRASGPRWTFGFGGVPLRIVEPAEVPPDPWQPKLLMADGSEQPLHGNIVTGYWVTTAFWRYDASSRTLYLPNGWVATYESDAWARLIDVQDAFGNTIDVNWEEYTTNFWRIDTIVQSVADAGASRSRTVEFAYDDTGLPWAPTSVSYGDQTWTYEYEGYTLMTRAEPPVGDAWQFSYGLTGLAGTIAVTTPAGGTVTYTFESEDLGGAKSVVREVETGGRAVAGGTWEFEYDIDGSVATSAVSLPSGRETMFAHQHRAGPNGFDWTLESRALSAASSEVHRLERTYTTIGFGSSTLWAVNVATVEQDGVTFTTDFDYSSSDYGDYLQPNTITESASNHGTTRVTTRTFQSFSSGYILPRVDEETVTIGSDSYTRSIEYETGTGFVLSQTVGGIATTFGRDDFGNVETVADPLNHGSWTEYMWGVPKNAGTPEYAIYRNVNENGTLATEHRGWAGPVTFYSYDALGRVTTVTPPEGTAVVTSYASDGSAVTVTRGSAWTTTVVDGFGRPIATENAEGVKTTATYDAEGRKMFQSAPFTGSSGPGTDFEYDALGRVKKVIHPDSAYVLYTYDGTSVTFTDELNRATTQTWQMFGSPGGGRLTSVVDAADQTWAYSYNAAGSLTLVDPPGSVPNRTWTYNSANQLTSETQPESGTTTYTYNGDGLLASRTDARDVTTTYTYDGNHRLVAVDAPGTDDDATFTYDARDNRTAMTAAGASSAFTFDAGSRLTARVDTIAGTAYTTAYQYDGRDNLTKVTYPSGREVQYDVDWANRITRVYGGGTTFADDLAYHPTGALTSADYGNGTSEALTLTSRFRPAHLTSGPLDVAYSYDAVGNVTAIDDARAGKDASFSYDALDRLTAVTGFGATTFSYDALGNRLTKGSGGTGVSYSYSSTTHRLTSATSALGYPEAATFTYDDAGNMTGDGTGTFTYSSRNMMTTAVLGSATTAYGYDADGLRVAKTTASGTTVTVRALGGQPLAEYRATAGQPALVREYIYLGSRLLASVSTADEPAPVGRVTGITTSSGSLVAGTEVTVTVTGDVVPCPSVKITYGDGTVTSYPLTSPYELPLVVPHTYTVPGLYTIKAEGESGAPGACAGMVSASLEVRTGNVVTNGDFSGGLNGSQTAPVGWSVFSGGASLEWDVADGFLFFRPTGSTQGGIEQATGLAVPAGAPLEATFTIGNTDTATKRVSVILRSSAWDDLAICNFYLPAEQAPAAYAMRMHTTVAWTNATINIYAADLTTSGTGAYVVDDVVVTYRPAQSSAKTDCVDANVPTSGGTTSGNLVNNGDFSDGTTDWALTGALASQVTSGVLEFHRTTDPTAPVVGQATDVGAGAGQRLAAVFELGNLSATRQRVTVTVQDDAAPASFQSCVFWLAAGTPRRAYAMTLYAPVAWDDLTLTVVPAAGGSAGTHGWLELDEVSIAKVTDAMLGTECFEPGSFVLELPSAPAPAALMALRQVTTGDDGARRVTTGEGVPALAGALRLVPTHVHAVTPPTVAALHAQAVARAARPAMPTGPARGLTLVANADAADERSTPAVTTPDGATTAVTWTASVVGTGTGTVSSSPAGLACGGTDVSCAGLFAEGATVTFTATPASGHAFAGWAGACTGTSTTCEVFIVGAQTVVATFTGPPTLTYYHLDVLGSVRAITDEAGDPVTRHDYAPFGESTSDLDGDPRRFLGQELDAETALDHFGARQYRNVWGRFVGVDPLVTGSAMTNPQRWNRYAYALNGPLRFVDPTGLAPWEGYSIDGGAINPEAIATALDLADLASWCKAVDQARYVEEYNRQIALLAADPKMGEALNRAIQEMRDDGGYRESGFYVWTDGKGSYRFQHVRPGPTDRVNESYRWNMPPPVQPEPGFRLLLQLHVHPSGRMSFGFRRQEPSGGDIDGARAPRDWRPELFAVVSDLDGLVRFHDTTQYYPTLDRRLDQFVGFRRRR